MLIRIKNSPASCLFVFRMQLNPAFSNSQRKWKLEIADSRWLKSKSNCNGFESEITGIWINRVRIIEVQLYFPIYQDSMTDSYILIDFVLDPSVTFKREITHWSFYIGRLCFLIWGVGGLFPSEMTSMLSLHWSSGLSPQLSCHILDGQVNCYPNPSPASSWI